MNEKQTLTALQEMESQIRTLKPDLIPSEMLNYWKERFVDFPSHTRQILEHLLWMIEQCREFQRAGRLSKLMRWLGFLQGTLWAYNQLTIDQLKAINRGDDSDPVVTLELEDEYGSLLETVRCPDPGAAADKMSTFMLTRTAGYKGGAVRFEAPKAPQLPDEGT